MQQHMCKLDGGVMALQCEEPSEGTVDHQPKQATVSQSGAEAHLVHGQPAEQ